MIVLTAVKDKPNPNLLSIIAIQGLSDCGTQLVTVSLPFFALEYFSGVPLVVGVLAAASSLPYLALSYPFGWIVDRNRTGPLMFISEICRLLGLAMLLFYLSSYGHTASFIMRVMMTAILIIVLSLGASLFEIAFSATLPRAFDASMLRILNSRISTANSLSVIIIPALVGLFVAAGSVLTPLLIDMVARMIALWLIHSSGVFWVHKDRPSMLSKRDDNFRNFLSLICNNNLITLLLSVFCMRFFVRLGNMVFVLALREYLDFSSILIGTLIAFIGLGVLGGSLFDAQVLKHVDLVKLTHVSGIVTAVGWFLVTLGLWWHSPEISYSFIAAGNLLFGFGAAIFNSSSNSCRQIAVGVDHQGVMHGAFQSTGWIALSAGSLLGGFLGTWVGLSTTCFIAALGIAISSMTFFALDTLTKKRNSR